MGIYYASRPALQYITESDLDYTILTNFLRDNKNNADKLLGFLANGDNVDLSTSDIAGKDFIYFDSTDKYSLLTYRMAISIFIKGYPVNTEVVVSEYINLIQSRFGYTGPYLNSESDVINHFYVNYAFEGTSDLITVFLSERILTRLTIWYDTVLGRQITDAVIAEIVAVEERISSEDQQEVDDNFEEDQLILPVIDFFRKVYFGQDEATNRNPMEEFFNRTRIESVGDQNIRATTRVFGTLTNDLSQLIGSDSLTKGIYARLESTGLIYLASYAFEISEFAKKRLQSVSSVKQSLNDYINPSVDTPWLTLLSQVTFNLQRDPISFSIINFYFPSLLTFVFDALAVVGDYSNNGAGGGSEDTLNNAEDAMLALEKAFGVNESGQAIFTLASREDFYTTSERIRKVLEDTSFKIFRSNKPPRKPDIFHLRLGAANFYVPPVSISVNSAFKAGSLTGGAIRQKNTPKFNTGYKETTVSMRLFFPNYEEIWGITIEDTSNINIGENFTIDFKADGDSEDKIDKFLSSLRGLVAAFKYSPILPIKNEYLNSVHGITSVALSAMSISTVPNYPFSLVVDLELYTYNHKPFLPMLKDFNQAIHWGKYRQYMGKAAGALHSYVNESFLIKTSDDKSLNQEDQKAYDITPYGASPIKEVEEIENVNTYENDILSTNILAQWRDGSNLSLFVPAETQTKIFLPDNTSFRSEQEKVLSSTSSGIWERLLSKFGLDVVNVSPLIKDIDQIESLMREPTYPYSTKKFIRQAVDILTVGINAEDYREQTYAYLMQSFISENLVKLNNTEIEWLKEYSKYQAEVDFEQYPDTISTYYRNGEPILQSDGKTNMSLNGIKIAIYSDSARAGSLLDSLIENEIARQIKSTGKAPDTEKVRQQVTDAFQVSLYERFFQDGFVKNLMEAVRLREGAYQFNEWEVPMNRVDLNPKEAIVNGVSVSMGNNLAKLQVQMQDEPTYQFIGGRDSYVNISLTVFGEKELIKIKSIFDHTNALARLEQSTGVIGFLGIKNIITALSGIKYVLPLNYRVDTIPNYPHVYSVQLSFVDFDIFQQKREKISSDQQKQLIEHFGSKRNPFLRIKQMWSSFNAYPDLPLELRDKDGNVVANLDPDYYFRSFQMFDSDIINHRSTELDLVSKFEFDTSDDWALGTPDSLERKTQAVRNSILQFISRYSYTNAANSIAIEERAYQNQTLINEIIDYVDQNGISLHNFISLFQDVIRLETSGASTEKKQALLTDFIFIGVSSDENGEIFEEINSARYSIGNVSMSSAQMENLIKSVLANSHFEGEDEVSFDPDEVDFFKLIYMVPGTDPEKLDSKQIPAYMQTILGVHFGYINQDNGRFYLTIDNENVKIESSSDSSRVASVKFQSNYINDSQLPEYGCTTSLTGVAGATSLDKYQKAYDGDFNSHVETMFNDILYRDLSGRMIRAFPTYMLWLIDEGGMFAGVKLFDNFYGLQSVIDFSVVSSEDLLGDTLILRLSNMYSKLTTRPSTEIFNARNDDFNKDPLNLTDGLSNILDRTLNVARNIVSGMRNDYVVDINNIRLKPGVRVHLRCGYGSNPNSLQTVFNGVITNIEQGEIVTVTAQSDAIELGAVVNSTNKKGDTGKIDGGVDTGMYLSEPRDLMVRLLSMGSSRFKEALARATNGTVFSENRFGIRHFGSVIYEPLNDIERARADGIRQTVAGVYNNLADLNIGGAANAATFRIANVFTRNPVSSLFGTGNLMTSMGQLISNYCSDVDLELFKRNIYPGNGTGFAQFLGGDIDDGWATMASLSETGADGVRLAGQGYLERGLDRSWNRLIVDAELGSPSANQTIENLTESNKLVSAENRAGFVAGVLKGAATIGLTAINPIAGGIAGAGLFGLLRGRGGTNFFRTMGIIAPNADDDLPGFDEVSFRAQTYMRTVWDIFQTCAKLLPNYIVAVRPFEDRSTIFYGKPHWLYTSGVVPVTTGFPSVRKANELNLPGYPKIISPNKDIEDIINQVSAQSNTLADVAAFKESTELSDAMAKITADQISSAGVYSPTETFVGKLINFNSSLALSRQQVDSQGNIQTVSKLPTNIGTVKVGFHLPVGDPNKTFSIVSGKESHVQLSNLPERFKYPYYTINESILLNKVSYQVKDGGLLDKAYSALTAGSALSDEIKDAIGDIIIPDPVRRFVPKNVRGVPGLTNSDGEFIFDIEKSYNEYVQSKSDKGVRGGAAFSARLLSYLFYEKAFITDNDITIIPSSNVIELDRPLGINTGSEIISGQAENNLSKVDDIALAAETAAIRMPLPSVYKTNQEPIYREVLINYNEAAKESSDYTFEYELPDQISYDEWGSPRSLEEEQFYIAMRWPYNPGSVDKKLTEQSIAQFKEKYKFVNLYGTAEDYKSRRVLVFSPLTGRAVVCAPAYFMWGESDEDTAAVVSPDAAWYLGSFISTKIDSVPDELKDNLPSWATLNMAEDVDNDKTSEYEKSTGLALVPRDIDCFFAFVPDDTPVGVVSSEIAPVKRFYVGEDKATNEEYIIGFGNFSISDSGTVPVAAPGAKLTGTADSLERQLLQEDPIFREWKPQNAELTQISYTYGGNILPNTGQDFLGYFQSLIDLEKISTDSDVLSRDNLYDLLDSELTSTGDEDTGTGRIGFAPVYSIQDNISVEARSFYDENFDPNVTVIAGNGRTLNQANDIWDQFRFGYHNYDSVKAIFAKAYGLDPEDTTPMPKDFLAILGQKGVKVFSNFSNNLIPIPGLSSIGSVENTAIDELSIILGSDFFTEASTQGSGQSLSELENRKQTIEFIRKNYIDATSNGVTGDAGIIEYFNNVISKSFDNIRRNFFENQTINDILQYSIENSEDPTQALNLYEIITTPKQLFLLMVGLFRQKLWSIPYGRAWLVLKPNRKRGFTPGGGGSEGQWSFKPVDKVFEAFINPNSTYAKDNQKFLQLLASTASEGNSSSTWVGGWVEDGKEFYNNTIGPVISAVGNALGGMLSMFQLNMMQMGYALSEVGNFSRQAHILNKVLNDSIYYSLGRPGTLLRAVDNPFTREYGEPVVEVRQPFQRLHYLSSFSHIISNQIQENLNNVATVVTAVSDGKNPITVALDKGAPPERQTEITVETGLYYDNMVGSGFLGVLHPLMHPLETFRGFAKNMQGTPDELSARRIALAHLRESIKDIYGGELTIIGNADIRPHDLVYLSDVYQRMYGIFEVEQVVHHFTPELGYITSITPNALVTVNDPSRWFLSSWIHGWFSVQNLRNDTRFYIDNIIASNTGINVGGSISIDALSDSLMPQMIGAIQFTHGSTALVKDIMSNQTALSLPDKARQLIEQQGAGAGTAFGAITKGILAGSGLSAAGVGVTAGLAGAGLAGGAALGLAAIPIVGQLAWKGWKWLRDNVLDQHGCYVQYLNKNGQPMDAGLSYNQGMIVGRHHSKVLLPGILGSRTKVRTPEGNIFIRSDDLLKSLGWKETEINEVVRYTDYQNALTHARVLQLTGLGPEKANLQPSLFRVVAKVERFIDGDTVVVKDIITGATFTVRFDGINTGETNTTRVGGIPNEPGSEENPTSITSISTPGGRAKLFVIDKLQDKVFILRIKISNSATDNVIFEAQFEPGANENTIENYAKDVTSSQRVLGTFWYYQPESVIQQSEQFVQSCFIKNKGNTTDALVKIENEFFKSVYIDSPLYVHREKILAEINRLTDVRSETTRYQPPNSLKENSTEDYGLSVNQVELAYDALVSFKVLEAIYNKTSEWPTIFWDEYYEDGYPVTLNWELVSNNLAQVYVKQILIESESTISSEEMALMPRRVIE